MNLTMSIIPKEQEWKGAHCPRAGLSFGYSGHSAQGKAPKGLRKSFRPENVMIKIRKGNCSLTLHNLLKLNHATNKLYYENTSTNIKVYSLQVYLIKSFGHQETCKYNITNIMNCI